MPTYRRINLEELNKIHKLLIRCFAEVRRYRSIFSFYFGFIYLYEYCICKAYFMLNDVEDVEGVSINVANLKKLFNNDVDACSTCNAFMRLRNIVGHVTTDIFELNDFRLLFSKDVFYEILQKCEVDNSIIDTLKSCEEYFAGNDGQSNARTQQLKAF